MKKTAMTWLVAMSCLCATVTAQAQERGRFKNDTKFTPKTKNNAPSPNQQRAEEVFEQETTQLRFNSQFEPKKELNPVVSEDTSSIDQGETSVVEVIQEMSVGDEWVKIADYYSVWDSRNIDPYNIDPRDFDQTVDLQLYDPKANHYWSAPLDEGKLTSQFGFRWGRWHTGVDLDLETGNPVYSAFDGIVRVVGWDGNGYGRYVLVRHYNGLETLYGHMSKQLVETGQLVKAGDQLGLGGSTGRSSGPHLHFETRYEGNPFAPINIYSFPANTIISDHFLLTPAVWDHLRSSARSTDLSFKPKFRQTVLHKVRSGETLSSIASRFGMSVSKLAEKNHLSSRSRLRAGQKLRVN
ncbi:peptidoglycan DD-metalloendopeptidase family protein [Fibrella forsythiae]|uniref:Peptidoglycan DD-metalloendopeptidase family protein n=1 Tax=Fibrella forsythiae TaxID=2817061 RepID=A0ABS3JL49_9BACT|nr:peptidoglycan DD-metalloendopeptidase family protein [Fibrella forsythiae]MBO0950739.1 peptidoglycan DD-metalloendopeptidase family protein [Fibrella forsythiae]